MTASHAIHLASQVVDNNPEYAPILFELLEGLIDPDGEALRYSAGEETMRFLYTFTPHFQEAYNSFSHSSQLELGSNISP